MPGIMPGAGKGGAAGGCGATNRGDPPLCCANCANPSTSARVGVRAATLASFDAPLLFFNISACPVDNLARLCPQQEPFKLLMLAAPWRKALQRCSNFEPKLCTRTSGGKAVAGQAHQKLTTI